MISKDLTKWLAKYGARFCDIQEDDEWGKYIIAEWDCGAGRILLPFEYQPKAIQDKIVEERFLEKCSLKSLLDKIS